MLLLPGAFEDPIRVHLLSITISDAPEYKALSYVWGDSKNKVEIECRTNVWIDIKKRISETRICRFDVTANLRDALRHIRRPTGTSTLWVDAVCINQNDDVERAKQVQMMGQIYYHSTRVVVWLGLSIQEIQHENGERRKVNVADVFDLIRDTVDELFDLPYVDTPRVTLEDLPKYDVSKWKAVADFFSVIPWFKRGWVIQELGLASDAQLLCGKEVLFGFQYFTFLQWLYGRADLLLHYFEIELSAQNLVLDYLMSARHDEFGRRKEEAEITEEGDETELHEDALNFLGVMESARYIQCTDPRDRVYAFLGHPSAFQEYPGDMKPYRIYEANFTENRPTIVMPDYTKTMEQVYLELCVALMKFQNSFEVLSCVTHTEETILSENPSWVPRWDIYGYKRLRSGAYYKASASMKPIYSVHSNELHTKAIKVDTVDWCEVISGGFADGLYQGTEGRPKRFDWYFNTYKFRLWQKHQGKIKADPEAFRYTLCAGVIGGHPAEDHKELFEANVAAYLVQEIGGLRTKKYDWCTEADFEKLKAQSVDGDPTRYLRDIQNIAEGRMLFFTRKGYLGIAHQEIRKGDVCCVLPGANVPFILRGKERRYRMICEAYLHGIMRGEAVAGLADDAWRDIKIY